MKRYATHNTLHLALMFLAILVLLVPTHPAAAQDVPDLYFSWSNIEPIYASSRLNGYSIVLTISNTGNATASALSLGGAPLNFVEPTAPTLPHSMGNVGAGKSVSVKLTYPASVGQPGLLVPIGAGGFFTGPLGIAPFSVSDNVELPSIAAVLTSLHSFGDYALDYTDGANPADSLIQASDGNLYGTCVVGGVNGTGTIFKITTGGVFTTLYSFSGGPDGAESTAGLIQASNGSLYGTTYWGGGNGWGAIFCLNLPSVTAPAIQVTGATLARSSTTGVITATLTLTNTGYQNATNVAIKSSTLGSAKTTTSLPVNVGTISGPGSTTVTLTYPRNAGATGKTVSLKVSGTFKGGSFNDSQTVTLP